MITWLKKFIKYLPKKDPKEAIRICLFVARILFELPAFFFHELSHLIFMWYFAVPHQTKIFYVLRFGKKDSLKGYEWKMNFQSYWYWESIVVCAAPLFMWIIYLVISLIYLLTNHHWYSYLPYMYGILAQRGFNLSSTDIASIRSTRAKYKADKQEAMANKK